MEAPDARKIGGPLLHHDNGNNGVSDSNPAVTQLLEQEPYSCIIELVDQYMKCGQDIPPDKLELAYNAFVEVTGYQPPDLRQVANEVDTQTRDIVNLNAFYIFVPILLVIVALIWVMVFFGWFHWAVGLFFTVFATVVLYFFDIAYRIHANALLNNRKEALLDIADRSQKNLQDSIAYWPQGLFAVSCAVTCKDGEQCWVCDETNPCITGSRFTGQNQRRPRIHYADSKPTPANVPQPRRRRRID